MATMEGKGVPYVRVKRRTQTVFLEATSSDSFASLKEQLGLIFEMPAQNIQLWHGTSAKDAKELTDIATLGDHGIGNDGVIYMCWKKENSDQWEELTIAKIETVGGGADSGAKAE